MELLLLYVTLFYRCDYVLFIYSIFYKDLKKCFQFFSLYVILFCHCGCFLIYSIFLSERRPSLKPTIKGPKSQTVLAGDTAIFKCKVLYSHLPYHIQWLQHKMINGSSWGSDGEPYTRVLQVRDNHCYAFVVDFVNKKI